MTSIRIVSFFCLLISAGNSLADQDSFEPEGVAAYYSRISDALKSTSASGPNSITVAFKPLFWHAAEGFKGLDQAWIVGARIATDKRFHYNVTAVVDSQGKAIMEFGNPALEADLGITLKTTPITDARIVQIAPGEQILAKAIHSGDSRRPGAVEIETISPEQRIILRDNGKAEGVQHDIQSWEGAYYFKDVNSDGRVDILLNRRISNLTNAGDQVFQNQKFIFEMEPESLAVRDITPILRDRLIKIFEEVKADSTIPVLYQSGKAQETAALSGEAIRPSEAEIRSVKFTAVQLPDIQNSSFLPDEVKLAADSKAIAKPVVPREGQHSDSQQAQGSTAEHLTEHPSRSSRTPLIAIAVAALLLVGFFLTRKFSRRSE